MESKSNLTEAEPLVSALKAHLAINVRTVEQSTEFYRKLFGIEPSKVRTGYAKFDLHTRAESNGAKLSRDPGLPRVSVFHRPRPIWCGAVRGRPNSASSTFSSSPEP